MRDILQRKDVGELRRLEAEEHLRELVAEALADSVPVEVRSPRTAAQVLALRAHRVERSRVLEDGADNVRRARRQAGSERRGVEQPVCADEVGRGAGVTVVELGD